LSATDACEVVIDAVGMNLTGAEGRILTGEVHAMNTFENKENVTIQPFTAVEATEKGLKVTLPACSVVALNLRG
ncbi:MAG: alpha-N-arabinofuranosidase, partial [Clostridia bacterium]|nr:alpha-N-arabinofuranosidase [Clostridia bacterium]